MSDFRINFSSKNRLIFCFFGVDFDNVWCVPSLAFRSGVLGAALLGITFLPAVPARADLGFWSHNLVGTWRHPTNGDRYRFGSDATYTFSAGPFKRRSGQLSHSGFWKIVNPTQRESGGSQEGPVALVLNARTRIVLQGRKRVVLDTRRSFRLVVDIAFDENGEGMDDNFYTIGKTRWIRVR